MHTNPNWKNWFVFSKKERTIVVSLLILLVVYLLFRSFYQPETEDIIAENLDDKIAQLSSQSYDSSGFRSMTAGTDRDSYNSQNRPAELFYFDPNTLDEAGFARLGIREKTVHTIINYRSKGGHFYKPDDLRKIYGLKEEEVNRLMPFVRIVSSNDNNAYNRKYPTESFSYHKPKPQIIDINTASVTQWQALPAIGEVLSNRIVKYRDKTGGFSSVDDIKKVYGITDSSYNAILPFLSFSGKKAVAQTVTSAQTSSQKLNINKASAAELKSNPNIPVDIAEAIVIYRKQHGNYISVEGIRKIVFINDEVYQKISPYLTTE